MINAKAHLHSRVRYYRSIQQARREIMSSIFPTYTRKWINMYRVWVLEFPRRAYIIEYVCLVLWVSEFVFRIGTDRRRCGRDLPAEFAVHTYTLLYFMYEYMQSIAGEVSSDVSSDYRCCDISFWAEIKNTDEEKDGGFAPGEDMFFRSTVAESDCAFLTMRVTYDLLWRERMKQDQLGCMNQLLHLQFRETSSQY